LNNQVAETRSVDGFCQHVRVREAGAPEGPLKGLEFAATDIFDIAGQTCCCGNPTWLHTHRAAPKSSPIVQALLEAGANLIGKTITDELAFSLNGINHHYGTPRNAVTPERIPGGSSSGSAVVAAAGNADFSIGSDTGGSVRVPAAFNGIFGFRPTHGALSTDGVMALARSFDAIGWFARSTDILRAVGDVLLPPDRPGLTLGRAIIALDALEITDPPIVERVREATKKIGELIAIMGEMPVAHPVGGLVEWLRCFRRLQLREIWAEHSGWIAKANPVFGPEIHERFDLARTVSAMPDASDRALRQRIERHLIEWLGNDTLIILPTAPTVAPLLDASSEEFSAFRDRTLALTAIAGLGRLPQVQIPLGLIDGAAIGLSLIAPRGSDRDLLVIADAVSGTLAPA
jgi:amidase